MGLAVRGRRTGSLRGPAQDRPTREARCTQLGTDFRPRSIHRKWVPIDPPRPELLARRRAIGEQIRLARRHRGLSQERLAERSGLDRKTVSRIENGRISPPLDYLLLIADALSTPLYRLVRDAEPSVDQ
ncbi:helix-turn-helix domain-containing protein [Streptomyces rimosus]|uniref:helix-turn-helix domain-containing protein n=1 Tax=Streptomyces rimosus TaxID=1927 RepID=UPI002D21BEDA|nr:helix-turn-helix domain-containing protein [Streptomyces rimosus]